MTERRAPFERFLSEASCAALARRIASFATGGGETALGIDTSAIGTVRFARNQIRGSTDVRNNRVGVSRMVHGAAAYVEGNQIDDVSLLAMVRRAEWALRFTPEGPDGVFRNHRPGTHGSASGEDPRLDVLAVPDEPLLRPRLFFEATAAFDAASRAAAVIPLIADARQAGVRAAGYIKTSAQGLAAIDTLGHHRYYPWTTAEYTITVRSPDGTGSGWAGVNWNEWARVDSVALSAVALDKCLRSRNPVRVEPGRYAAILEPQAVFDLLKYIIEYLAALPAGRIVDPRITVTQDPMDPDCGSLPFDAFGNPVYAGALLEHGQRSNVVHPPVDPTMLVRTGAFGEQAAAHRAATRGPDGSAFRMHGEGTTLDAMMAGTLRGLYITRFSNITLLDEGSLLLTGYTRDGTWLVENGTVTKPVKNFRFTDSPLFIFNKLEQLGVEQRVYSPPLFAAVVPSAKVGEINFTGLTDAV